MYQADTEILYPMRITPQLRDLRGGDWENLVDAVCAGNDSSPSGLAFNLMIIKLTSCLSCHTHSYRAMRGCTSCATHAVRRYEGSDADLLVLYDQAQVEVHSHLELSIALQHSAGR